MASLDSVEDKQTQKAQPTSPLRLTQKVIDSIKSGDMNLFVSFQEMEVYRANGKPNEQVEVQQYVGTLESARAYLRDYPYLGTYEMPPGYYMVLDSPSRIIFLDRYFRRLLQSMPDVTARDKTNIADTKGLHILFRVMCGMGNMAVVEQGQNMFTYGYTNNDLEHLLQSCRKSCGDKADTLRALIISNKGTPTRISIRRIDQYMARAAVRLLVPEVGDPVVEYGGTTPDGVRHPDKRRRICGIITSCRSVGESIEGTNAKFFKPPHDVAVAAPSELISFLPLQVRREQHFPKVERETKSNGAAAATNGGKRTRRSRKRTRKSRKHIKRNRR